MFGKVLCYNTSVRLYGPAEKSRTGREACPDRSRNRAPESAAAPVGSAFAWFVCEAEAAGSVIGSGALNFVLYCGDTVMGAAGEALRGDIFYYR